MGQRAKIQKGPNEAKFQEPNLVLGFLSHFVPFFGSWFFVPFGSFEYNAGGMPFLDAAFWNQPIDVLLYELLTWFGWIPLAITVVWGLILVWKNHRQNLFTKTLTHVLLAVDVPAATEQTPKAVESLFASLASVYSNLIWKETWIIGKLQPTFSFEIVSTEGYVQFYIRTQAKYRDAVEAGIYAHYPDAEISEVEDYTNGFPLRFPNETHEMWGAELNLKEDQIFPIRTYADFEDKVTKEYKDPLGLVLEQLAKMRPGEHFWAQVLCQVTNNKWKDEGIAYIDKVYGVEPPRKESGWMTGMRTVLAIPDAVLAKTLGINMSGLLLGEPAAPKEQDQWKAFKLTETQREQTKAVLQKIGKPGMLTKLRSVYIARKEAYNKGARVAFVKGLYHPYAHLNLNAIGFSPLTVPKDDYFWQKWSYAAKQNSLMRGYVMRDITIGGLPKVFNVEELATLWHFPAIGVKAPLIKKAEARRGEPPTGLPVGSEAEDIVAQGAARAAAAVHAPAASAAAPPPVPEPAFPAPSVGEAELPHPSLPGAAAPPPAAPPAPLSAAPRTADVPPSGRGDRGALRGVEEKEETERGLDATDMGPPSDVVLPGPPPGFPAAPEAVEDADGDGAREGEPPMNLPV